MSGCRLDLLRHTVVVGSCFFLCTFSRLRLDYCASVFDVRFFLRFFFVAQTLSEEFLAFASRRSLSLFCFGLRKSRINCLTTKLIHVSFGD